MCVHESCLHNASLLPSPFLNKHSLCYIKREGLQRVHTKPQKQASTPKPGNQMMYKFVQSFDHCWMDRAPSAFSPLSFLTLAWAKRDLGLALLACLFRKALILAVQGLMMLSDGETYCLVVSAAILDWNTWRWYSMLLTSLLAFCWSMVALTSLSPRTADIVLFFLVRGEEKEGGLVLAKKMYNDQREYVSSACGLVTGALLL
uniref:Uncharacterized protein n=1 Tax=Photinus pyralis TaxID=7054 RepID=A0A1Y1KH25_PHOPY